MYSSPGNSAYQQGIVYPSLDLARKWHFSLATQHFSFKLYINKLKKVFDRNVLLNFLSFFMSEVVRPRSSFNFLQSFML